MNNFYLRLAALLGGLGLATGAAAGDYASVSTDARFINPLTGPLHILPSCVSSFSRGLASESTGTLTCNAGAAGNHAGFEVSASASGPSSGGLPLLGAAARVLVPQGSWRPRGAGGSLWWAARPRVVLKWSSAGPLQSWPLARNVRSSSCRRPGPRGRVSAASSSG